jgi:hypothetical protein
MIPYNTAVVLAGCALLGLAAGTVGAFALRAGGRWSRTRSGTRRCRGWRSRR